MHKGLGLGAVAALAIIAAPVQALQFDQNVTNNVIYGSGNTNGSWTLSDNPVVELGLRAHVRYDLASDQPQNVFNSQGNGHYIMDAGAPASNPDRARWNFDFSINTSAGGPGSTVGALTYRLRIDYHPSPIVEFLLDFDPINVPFADHSFGNNGTGEGDGEEAADAAAYDNLLASRNLVQNSWNLAFFPGPLAFDPNVEGSYTIALEAYNGSTLVAFTDIVVDVLVPEPGTIAVLLGGLSALGLMRRRKVRR